MKLDANVFRYLTKDDWRVLTAVDMGMKNHELVSAHLVESIAALRRGGCYKVLQNLLKHKLVSHEGKPYDGYKLTYLGYDFLALRTLTRRGHLAGVGRRIGVGKESDIHLALAASEESYHQPGDSMGEVQYAMKLHRLGRVSFRTIKRNRDYMQHRTHASWMYLAHLAAKKEFAYMKALHSNGFPVPKPIDMNRHVVLMDFIPARPMRNVTHLKNPTGVADQMFGLIRRFAEAGLIHGDFNEFNLMISEDEKLTVIDFPQVVSMDHVNARMYFERDVNCVVDFFKRRLNLVITTSLTFEEALALHKRNMERQGQKAVLSHEDEALLQETVMREQAMPDEALSDDEAENEEAEDEEEAEESAPDAVVPLGRAGNLKMENPDAESSSEDEDEDEDEDEGDSEEVVRGPKPQTIKLGHVLKKKRVVASEAAARKGAQKHRAKIARSNSSKNKDKRRAHEEIKDMLG
jgi:RIO kinase 2